MNEEKSSHVDRRTAIKWMLTVAAAATLADEQLFGADTAALAPRAAGYGTDPDLLKTYKPGDLWPLTFTAEQRLTAVALCDTIIPADGTSSAASEVGVPEFIDEWISAPYPDHERDRRLILEGLAWLDEESQRRFQSDFSSLVLRQKNSLCEDIARVATATPERKKAAQFFKRYRYLTAGGYYTTPEGMKDIGYVGNVPLPSFEGPPPEVLRKLGLA